MAESAKRRRLGTSLVVVAGALVSQVALCAPESVSPAAEPVEVVSLADSLRPLQDRFAEAADGPHFVALLSPT